jgi:hypothetical protein
VTATPPRADLRTLATHAAHDVDCPEGPNCGDELTTDGRYGRYADAVLAAVLPEHRRVVLAEAAGLAESMVKTWPGMGDQAKAGNEHLRQAARRIRRLAAAAPPAGLRASMPAETAPAVPEEADGQRAGEGPYRVGRKVGRTIYRMVGDQPSDTDELIGVMDSPALAAFAVRGMNADTEMESERGRLAQELYEARTRLAIYEHTITWNTTCHNCAAILDSAIRETDRAEQAEADRDRLAAQVAQDQPVVEAAKAWRAARPGPWVSGTDVEFHLLAAVDALSDAGTDQTEDER